jgi:hypothetical protein
MVSPFKSNSYSREGRLAPGLQALVFLILLLVTSGYTQDLPDKIRGYKVHSEKMIVSIAGAGDSAADASVAIGEPQLVEAGLAGVTFELPAEILAVRQSGKVTFLTFHDIRVNGIAVEVEEYRNPFEFRKGETIALPKPARVVLPATVMLKAAMSELHGSRDNWTISGRVFVFGRFRKFGMYHKRVIPVDFELRIKNPLISS